VIGTESPLDLFSVRSLLFLPASNPRAIGHARESAADLVILDLEDAVKPELKERAREAAVEALGQDWPMPVAIRINSPGTDWHAGDLAAVMKAKPAMIVVPRAEGKEEISFVRNQTGRPVAAMIETARGLVAIHATAREAAALIAGTNDLAADLRLPSGAGRKPLQMALQSIVLAARAARIAVFDGVFNGLEDEQGFVAEAAEGRNLGFDGKSLIHPGQIGPCHRAFAPDEEEIARAERLLAAATGGAERFEGQMIERMHVDAARRLLGRR
jgi:citrate lyase beta subunit